MLSSQSSSPLAISLVPGRARACRCETPWRSEDTCVRCGHLVPGPAETAPEDVAPPRRSTASRWTRSGVVRALRAHQFFVGRPPTPTDWSFEDDSEWPSVKTVVSLFGSFDTAVAAAGVIHALQTP
jgi:hypothetical protein